MSSVRGKGQMLQNNGSELPVTLEAHICRKDGQDQRSSQGHISINDWFASPCNRRSCNTSPG